MTPCPSTTPHGTHTLACCLPEHHPGEHRANGPSGNLLAAWDTTHPVDDLYANAPVTGCLLTEDTDDEAFAALPDCEHCQGTGKNLAGTPWEDTR